MVFSCFQSCAQTDDQSNGVYHDIYINKTWERLDENKDGLFSEEDNKRKWKHLNRLDSNEDNHVSFEEFAAKKYKL